MTDRNLFDTLYFKQSCSVPPVIDLTDDIEDSDEEEEILFPDSFSSSVGKILNEKSISAVLSNVEVFYKSQIEYLEDNRYEKPIPLSNSSILDTLNEDLQCSKLSDKNDFSNNNIPNSSNQSFSSYYFIKQTFNCPMVLIDHLISTMSDMKLKENELEIECPKQIEIDTVFDTDKSNIITKRDLRLLSYYKPPKPKKSRPAVSNKSLKQKACVQNSCKKESADIPLEDSGTSAFEVIEISDSEEEDNELMESTFNEIQGVAGY